MDTSRIGVCKNKCVTAKQAVGIIPLYQCKHASAGNTTEELRGNIIEEFSKLHSAVKQHAKRYGRINVASGNIAYKGCNGDNGKTKCKSNSDICQTIYAHGHGNAASKEHKQHRAKELSTEFLTVKHTAPPLIKCLYHIRCDSRCQYFAIIFLR